MAKPEGIETRHRAGCPANPPKPTGACECQPSYRAVVRGREGKVTRTFHRQADAKAWRNKALGEIARIPRLAIKAPLVRVAADAAIEAMEGGSLRTRSGDPYKPSVIRGYRSMLDTYIVPALGDMRLDQVRLRDVQAIADRILADGFKPSTAKNALMPLRVIYRRALRDEHVALNPCTHLELPATRSKKSRIVSPEHAAQLLAALDTRDRALWGCAFYAGLRVGEIRALTCDSVDLASGLIHVRAGWDRVAGSIEPKSRAGVRDVIIVAALRDHLTEYAVATSAGGLLFPGAMATAFDPTGVRRRAFKRWRELGLAGVGLHDARHTCASIFIAAGVNAKALSEMMGHSSITVTFDTYGHLMPGSRDEARELVDAYLERALR